MTRVRYVEAKPDLSERAGIVTADDVPDGWELRRKRKSVPGDAAKAVAYYRVSTDKQDADVPGQRLVVTRWAKANGVQLVGEGVDKGVSGGAPLHACLGLLQAIRTLREQKAGVLVVAKRDRLARDVMKATMVDFEVERLGATVVSADGVGNGTDPSAVLMRRMLDAFASFERSLAGARTKMKLDARRAEGRRVSLQAPFGKRFVRGHVVDNPAEQRMARRAQQLWRNPPKQCRRPDGAPSLRKVSAKLYAEGFKSRTGQPITPKSLQTLVRAVAV